MPERIVQLHWIGRLGNRMFQYAFGCEYAFLHKCVYYYPSAWEGTVLFKPFEFASHIEDERLAHCLNSYKDDTSNERKICISGTDLAFIDFHAYEGDGINIAFDDLSMMYLQKRFQTLCSTFVKEHVFAFSDLVKGTAMYQDLEKRRGTYVVAHIRRGDIVHEKYKGSHSAVTLASYLKQLSNLGIAKERVVWICEDPKIATKHKWYFSKGDMGWKYPEGQRRLNDDVIFDFLPDLLTIYFAKTILRGNSSFSWWAAELSEANVYSPVVPDRPSGTEGPYWVDCLFVDNNKPHFMGQRFDDIEFRGTCTVSESLHVAGKPFPKDSCSSCRGAAMGSHGLVVWAAVLTCLILLCTIFRGKKY